MSALSAEDSWPATFRTSRLLLRPAEAGDVHAFTRLWTDPEVRRFLGGPVAPSSSSPSTRRRFAGRPYVFSVTTRDEAVVVGSVSVEADSRFDGRRAVSYAFLPEYWGRGYGCEAVAAVVGWALEAIPSHDPSAVAVTQEANVRSRRLLESIGMRPVVQLRGDRRAPGDVIHRPSVVRAGRWETTDRRRQRRRNGRWRARRAGDRRQGATVSTILPVVRPVSPSVVGLGGLLEREDRVDGDAQRSAVDQGGDRAEPGPVGLDEHEPRTDPCRRGLCGREGVVQRQDRDQCAAGAQGAQGTGAVVAADAVEDDVDVARPPPRNPACGVVDELVGAQAAQEVVLGLRGRCR